MSNHGHLPFHRKSVAMGVNVALQSSWVGVARTLAASYKVNVQFGTGRAATDGQTIFLPSNLRWDLDPEEMLVLRSDLEHEVAHIRFSDFDAIHKYSARCTSFAFTLLNALEDPWIEWKHGNDYFGAAKMLRDSILVMYRRGWMKTGEADAAEAIQSLCNIYGDWVLRKYAELLPIYDEVKQNLVGHFGQRAVPLIAKLEAVLAADLPASRSTTDNIVITEKLLAILGQEVNQPQMNTPQQGDPEGNDKPGDPQSGSGGEGDGDQSKTQSAGSDAEQGRGDSAGPETDDKGKSDEGKGTQADAGDAGEENARSEGQPEGGAEGGNPNGGEPKEGQGDPSRSHGASNPSGGKDGGNSEPSADQGEKHTSEPQPGSKGEPTGGNSGEGEPNTGEGNPQPGKGSTESGQDSPSSSDTPSGEGQGCGDRRYAKADQDKEEEYQTKVRAMLDTMKEGTAVRDYQGAVESLADPNAPVGTCPPDLSAVSSKKAGERRDEYQKIRSAISSQIGVVANQLMVLLRTRVDVRRRISDDGEELRSDLLPRARMGDNRIYQTTTTRIRPKAAVSLVADLSSSTRGECSEMTQKLMIILTEAMEIVGNPSEVVGFATSGSSPVLTTFKGFNERCAQAQGRLGTVLNEVRGFTPMAEAVLESALRLMTRPEQRKLMLVLTDGEPDCRGEAVTPVVQRALASGQEVIFFLIGEGATDGWLKQANLPHVRVESVEDLGVRVLGALRDALLK